VHADNYARFGQDYREIAKLAQLPEKPNETEQELLFRVRRWLESPISGPWIIIVDNADNLAEFFPSQDPDADGKKPIGLALYLPQGTKGCILVTTRDRVVASRLANQDILEVKAMSPDEAEALLLRYAPDAIPTTAEKDALPRLLEEVKYLPLAIVAAAAFMRENDVSIIEYLELYTQSKQTQSELMGSEFYDFRRGAEVPEAVLTTYFMPFQRLQRQSPLATDFLRLIAFFDSNGIPKQLLLESKLPGTESPVQFTKAVGSLLSLGLMSKSADGSMYHVHQLVHLSIEAFFPDEDGTWRSRAMEILLKLFHLFPNQEKALDKWNWESCATYSPHVQAALEKMSPEAPSPTERMLLVRLATYLEAAGRSRDAEAHLRRCTASSDAIEGDDLMNLEILEGYIMLGKTLESQAKWEQAEDLYTLIVARSEKSVGLDNPIVIAVVRLLIKMLVRRGNLSRAEQLTRSLVERYKRVLGEYHPDVVLIVHRLAKILRKQDKYDEAESLYQWAVIRTDIRQGPTHPYTLISITRLALVLQCRGQYQISEEVLQRALTRYEQFQDPVNDLTLGSFIKLARVLEQQRNLDQAEKILRRATSGYEKSRGRMDPRTLSCLRNLGSLLCKKGDFKQAEEIQRQLLERWEELLGTENPYALSDLFDLAMTLQEQGKYPESESCFRRALEGYEKVSPEHPATLKCLGCFGILRALQGNQDEGVALCQRATDGLEKLLGAEHRETQNFKTLMGLLLCVARDSPAHMTEPIPVYGQLTKTSFPPSQPPVENWTVTECGTVLYMESLD
jgi:tetratricopeptide (TPR) repeat protein